MTSKLRFPARNLKTNQFIVSLLQIKICTDPKQTKHQEERALSHQEREKIIEVLHSQERVLTLLYDKTFPPRPTTATIGALSRGISAQGARAGTAGADMR